jgi:hypothetical protein
MVSEKAVKASEELLTALILSFMAFYWLLIVCEQGQSLQE